MDILIIKALHIIFVVTWFAGLFYIVRLFIYHSEALSSVEPAKTILINQYRIMEYRLWYYITWPSAILASLFGLYLVYVFDFWFEEWMIAKLIFVVGLWIYHLANHKLFITAQKSTLKSTSQRLRIWNEVATLLLFAIVFLVVLKSQAYTFLSLISFLVLGLVLMLAIKWYKKVRK